MNQKKLIGITIAIIAIAFIAGIVVSNRQESDLSTSPDNTAGSQTKSQTTDNTQSENSKLESITSAEVANHNNREDCWTIINGNVYDITNYIDGHPGMDEILRACGTDATTLFETRRTDDGERIGTGTPHSSSAERTLGQFQIGVLAD